MQNLKFRAWNKKIKEMVDLHKITPMALAIQPELAGGGTGVYIPDHPDLDIMQSTGLKDKNGKEIFEGDIVMRRNSSEPGIIHYAKGRYEVVRKIAVNSSDLTYTEINTEVIGNIYQNPDLIGE
jgi:uncharacterized phage protein (TIGR01671 family)